MFIAWTICIFHHYFQFQKIFKVLFDLLGLGYSQVFLWNYNVIFVNFM
jgi:hypothetical protein